MLQGSFVAAGFQPWESLKALIKSTALTDAIELLVCSSTKEPEIRRSIDVFSCGGSELGTGGGSVNVELECKDVSTAFGILKFRKFPILKVKFFFAKN